MSRPTFPTDFVGGPHDRKHYELIDQPAVVPINNCDWRGKYLLREIIEEGVSKLIYSWQQTQGRPPANADVTNGDSRLLL